MRKIVAFAGRQGSGKNYRCDQLVKQGNYKSMAFADALRKIAFCTLGFTYEYGMEHYDELKASPIVNGLNFRQILERLGTEGIRHYDKDFWVKCLLKDMEEVPEELNICVSDLRFHNEYKLLKDYAVEHGYEFDFIFCDYHSDRYLIHNPHASARLAEFLKEVGYEDGDRIKEEDMQCYINALEEIPN